MNMTQPIVTVYLALGSNLDQPLTQIESALTAIQHLPDTTFIACSPFYRTKPLGGLAQPDYLNAVVKIETTLSPEALLDKTQQIENNQGRVRTNERWSARTLDIDMLLYANHIIQTERLTVPHHGLYVREFMLYPLFDLAPDLVLPNHHTLRQLVASTDKNGMQLWFELQQ